MDSRFRGNDSSEVHSHGLGFLQKHTDVGNHSLLPEETPIATLSALKFLNQSSIGICYVKDRHSVI